MKRATRANPNLPKLEECRRITLLYRFCTKRLQSVGLLAAFEFNNDAHHSAPHGASGFRAHPHPYPHSLESFNPRIVILTPPSLIEPTRAAVGSKDPTPPCSGGSLHSGGVAGLKFNPRVELPRGNPRLHTLHTFLKGEARQGRTAPWLGCLISLMWLEDENSSSFLPPPHAQ